MTIEHPLEMELQQYVLNKTGCSKEVAEHIEQCEHCKLNAAAYRLVFGEIEKEQKPIFNFDVAALVMPQIQTVKVVDSPARFPAYIIAAVIFCAVAIPLYLFRKNIFFMFSGSSAFFLYTTAAATLLIIAYGVFDLYKRYQQQMRALNFY